MGTVVSTANYSEVIRCAKQLDRTEFHKGSEDGKRKLMGRVIVVCYRVTRVIVD